MSVALRSSTYDSTDVNVYILGGQSNMSGRGGVERFPDGTKVFDEEGPDSGGDFSCSCQAVH